MPLILSDTLLTEYERRISEFLKECMSRSLDLETVLRINQLLMMRAVMLWMTDDDIAILRNGDVDAMLALIAGMEDAMSKSERSGRNVH